ncbi:prophage tail fiber N-terminal domain-containing protein [Escherichia coli]|uniref:prophage tail fiber N-terminal domain-containing protein n=2 Tax=Escherichia coli TaxID=562 RepID=UPI000A2FBC5B|nr:prophage tail fiber N-terminal domain-containing protein [Escherichia coli]HBN2404935.1 prophage tail fiber N-terminal domain-containing protein [Escherichia coli O25b:H4-ST131]ARR63864.1 phage tail protein [Escherichia coli]MBS8535715.1 prophage tail fiber N-terminal domain-containing protein [Escherichia coli]MDL7157088.1 prophage tail fiber N-terminal domain-containing protein [Escherichia coli]MDL7200840.1 prophage tail fiber N-terminal domain-containing protein [Escherichia coli]
MAAVKISGVLKDGAGKPIQNCTIQLKAKRNSTTVVVNTVASENPDEAGRYSMDVEYGQYSVILLVEGFPPSHAGAITVYEDSKPGTLNDFLGAATEDDVRPEALYRFEKMVEEVARNAEAASQSAAAAKKSETAAASSRNAAKTSETNAGNSAKAAASSKTAAQNAATAAERSETNARASEEASAGSEEASRRNAESAAENAGIATTKAREAAADATTAGQKKDEALSAATRAEKAADRAEAAAEVTAEPYANIVPPLPDVWIPFNDSLDMITGFSPSYKKIVIGDDEITMPGDKIVKFKRASTATYINKSGQLKLAEVDEPRFERDGLLIEGQRTNYLRNSNKPDSWTVHSALNKTFGTDKRGFNYATVTPTESIVGTTGGYTVHGVVAADRFPLASGECFTFSCRVKGAKARCRLRVSVIIGGTDTFSADSYLDLDTRIATVSGNTSLITAKAEQQGEWTYYESTYTANTDIDTVNCAFYMSNKISNEPFYDDSTLTMTTPQIELGNTASSFIVTTMPTTRASDVVTIPSQNNLSTRPFTVLCEVSRSWSTPPNVAPRIFDVGGHSIDDNYLSLGFVSTGKISANVGMVQPQIASDGERFIVGVRAKSDLSVNAICNGNYTTNLNGKIFGITATSYRFGGQTAAGTRHLFGHIRNFRVWFKELNDRQIKEAV